MVLKYFVANGSTENEFVTIAVFNGEPQAVSNTVDISDKILHSF